MPKIMREQAEKTKCVLEVGAFENCYKEHPLAFVALCRNENDLMKSCMTRWYQDEGFKRHCAEIYLKDRSEFRRTGLQKKHREYLEKRREAGIEDK